MKQVGKWMGGGPALGLLIPLVGMAVVGCGESTKKIPPSASSLIEARHAVVAGDTAKAMEALTASIDYEPNVWALMERAKLHVDAGDTAAAKADCEKVLELDPSNRDVPWLQKEMEKPAAKRFQGRNQLPPSHSK